MQGQRGAVVVLLLAVVSFSGDIVWFFQSAFHRIQGKWYLSWGWVTLHRQLQSRVGSIRGKRLLCTVVPTRMVSGDIGPVREALLPVATKAASVVSVYG